MPENKNINLVTNAYKIDTPNPDCDVHQYDLDVELSIGSKNFPPKVTNRAFVQRSIRKLIMDKIVPKLTSKYHPKGSILIELNLSHMYTLNRLGTENDDNIVQDIFEFKDINVDTDLISPLLVDITIKYSKSFKLTNQNQNISLISTILHHQLCTDLTRYLSVYYLSDQKPFKALDKFDLISDHLMGISISGARRSADNQTLVVINSSHSHITQAYRIIDLLVMFVEQKLIRNDPRRRNMPSNTRLISEIISKISNDDREFSTFSAILNGFKCYSQDPDGRKVNLRFLLTNLSSNELYIDDGITVYSYYKSRGIDLIYPNLPCIQTRSSTHFYYPIELCALLPGQKVPIFRLDTDARANLMKLNKPNPNQAWRNSVEARNEIVKRTKDQCLQYGLNLSQTPVEAIGSTLTKPILQYKNRTIFPPNDYWESACFYQTVDLVQNWCIVDTVGIEEHSLMTFFREFSRFSQRFGFNMAPPSKLNIPKSDIIDARITIESIIEKCSEISKNELKLVIFIIDANSTIINRMIHLSFDDHPKLTATCLRSESILNQRHQKSIHRTFVHKLNSRLGGTNHTYNQATWERLSLECSSIMIVGLDVTHPDNELNGVSIVGCAYTYSKDLFRHKSLVWPQTARKEIIAKMDKLMERILRDYKAENKGQLPNQIIIYRDGVSHEEFDRVRDAEISKAIDVIDSLTDASEVPKPKLSYIIAQKRHTMRFFRQTQRDSMANPPGGTLIDHGIVPQEGREFYLYSNTSPNVTARPLHYHVLLNSLGLKNLQKLTYYLCFNFGKCSTSLSMPSSLKYAHNAAYDARNRVIASREFHENKFYTTKFFC